MINMDDKLLKKLYIEETLKSKKYIGYRLDIALIKTFITITVLFLLYLKTNDLLFSLIMGIQIFLILTLLNKIIIDKKITAGKEKLSQRIKKEKFKKKIFNSDYIELENFIMFYLNQYRYKEITKIQDYSYSAIKNEEAIHIHLVKFYEDATIEKIDIRNLLTMLINNKVKKATIIFLNNLNEDAQKLLDEKKDKINIELLNLDDLYNFANSNSLLSESYEYNDIENLSKKIHNKTSDIISNILINKKLILYLLAAGLFYFTSKVILQNSIGIYIAYYFLILAAINIIYNLYQAVVKKKIENK